MATSPDLIKLFLKEPLNTPGAYHACLNRAESMLKFFQSNLHNLQEQMGTDMPEGVATDLSKHINMWHVLISRFLQSTEKDISAKNFPDLRENEAFKLMCMTSQFTILLSEDLKLLSNDHHQTAVSRANARLLSMLKEKNFDGLIERITFAPDNMVYIQTFEPQSEKLKLFLHDDISSQMEGYPNEIEEIRGQVMSNVPTESGPSRIYGLKLYMNDDYSQRDVVAFLGPYLTEDYYAQLLTSTTPVATAVNVEHLSASMSRGLSLAGASSTTSSEDQAAPSSASPSASPR